MTINNQQIKRSRIAIISLIIAILSLLWNIGFFFSDVFISDFFVSSLPVIILALTAIILGHISFQKIKTSNGILKGKKNSLSAFLLGYLSLAFLIFQFAALTIHSYLNPPNYEVVLQLQETPQAKITPILFEKTEKSISTRLDDYRVPHKIYKKDSNTLIIQIRVTKSFKEQNAALLFENKILSFHLVHQENDALVKQMSNPGFVSPTGFIYSVARGETLFVESKPLLVDNIEDAEVNVEPSTSTPIVVIQFNPEGTQRFAQVTKDNIGRRLAISIDDKIFSAPRITQAIFNGRANINGLSSIEEARTIELALKIGRIPVPVHIIDQHYIKR